ncbi:MAG: ThiF family adenylyltransferase [Planctomycetaceae bacterium]
MTDQLDRYSKQVLFQGIGLGGQQRLRTSRVLLCGCGALGTVLADTLIRAGVGFMRIVDRDFVELSNLQRQVLFDEADVEQRLPKAVAAEAKLRAINSEAQIEPLVQDIAYDNILALTDGVDLILDGTDNFEVRFLINDASLETGIPWIYAGCIGSHGQSMPVFPGESACLRCLMGGIPDPATAETCDTAGVLAPAINVIASLQSVDALKILSGQSELVARRLTVVDVWDGSLRQINVSELREQSDCPACHAGERLWLSGRQGSQTVILCGRNAVQVSPQHKFTVSFSDLSIKLSPSGTVQHNRYLLRFRLREPEFDITVFRDGRAIIKGTEDVAQARGIYARYIGS